ncbi:hypothetical protein CINS5915_02570 [Campylobacter insulaenigrae]|uniref:hypothetical protein n=1 Tax=Campylobacter insulaenigrae TaxID=260714 RepID=UPI0021530E95|nr:hypothetical protein [Campylobacter insulaenigrae]MCR6575253.1 hypothetical protein [Campylobacter insulaenigrae]
MNKEIKKHLDNPNLRGMVTTQEMLSFPKVAKNVEASNEARGYTWQVKANDENILVYGSRKYETNNEKIHRLATSHSKTEQNERQAEVGGRSHPHHPIFNDFNFRKSAENIIPQENKPINDFKAKFKEFITKNKNYISNQRTGVKRVFIVLNVLDY